MKNYVKVMLFKEKPLTLVRAAGGIFDLQNFEHA
jgi:hypothetical protein